MPQLGREYGAVGVNSSGAAGCLAALCLVLAGCGATLPVDQGSGQIEHLEQASTPAPGAPPAPVGQTVLLPSAPAPASDERLTVVVFDVPARELIFAIARDSDINVDIHPRIEGSVSLNAVDQTLVQLLDRISEQVSLAWEWRGQTLVIRPDEPVLRRYAIDYLNVTRNAQGSISVASSVAATGSAQVGGGGGGGGGGSSESSTVLTNISEHGFWARLEANVRALLTEDQQQAQDIENRVIVNPETGMLAVKATLRQHREVQGFLEEVIGSSQRQVLIEATIIEARLGDDYQAGIDWSRLGSGGSSSVRLEQTVGSLRSPPAFTVAIPLDPRSNLQATLRALSQFGSTRVLSSPKIMALNNQAALLKVVDEIVYFEVESDVTISDTGGFQTSSVSSEARTVPVGLVMAVTPQISAGEIVSLNVRPTVSRVTGFREDPVPRLLGADFENLVPEIQIREMESILRITSGQTVLLGGLMQDEMDLERLGVPVLSRVPGMGRLFRRDREKATKSELVILLRPTVLGESAQVVSVGGVR